MPRFGKAGPQTDVIAEAGWKLFKSAPDALPCSQLSLSATEFADAPVAAGKSIARFFAAVPEGAPAEPPSDSAPPADGADPGGGAAGERGGHTAGQRRQPRWERVKGTIAHSFARVPGAGATHGDAERSDEAPCAPHDGAEQTAHAADAEDALPEDSRREQPAAGTTGAAEASSSLQTSAADGAELHLSAAGFRADASGQHVTLQKQPRSRSEPSVPAAKEQRNPVSQPQRPLGRSRTATAAEVLARRAAFESAAESAIAACMLKAQLPTHANGDRHRSTPAGGSEVRRASSPPADVAPQESRPHQSEPPLQSAGANSGGDAIDLSSIDAREQDRILQEIASRRKATQPQLAGAGAKRRSGGRGGGRTAKRTNQDPRQLGMERFMGSS